jgi:hypothetical protein
VYAPWRSSAVSCNLGQIEAKPGWGLTWQTFGSRKFRIKFGPRLSWNLEL